MKVLPLIVGVCSVFASVQVQSAVPAARVATVQDAIAMTRIQYSVALDGAVAAISPDTQKAAVVTWRGDLARNLNVYTLQVLDLRLPLSSRKQPVEVLSLDFPGDEADQVASPFQQLTFLGDNKTLAFIGRQGDVPQVYIVDTVTKKLTQLTRHPTAVRSFVVGSDGALKLYAAVASADSDNDKSRLETDGVFMWDKKLFPTPSRFFTPGPLFQDQGGRQIREYFLASDTSRPFFSSRQSRLAVPIDINDPKVALSPTGTLEDEHAIGGWASITGDPQNKRALLFPYGLTDHPMNPERYAYYGDMNAYARRVAAPYGLVDLTTGRIERLIDAPHPQFGRGGGEPVWSKDGSSVIVYTLLPEAPAEKPRWVEVDIATRKFTALGAPEEWRPVAWAADGVSLIMNKGASFGQLTRGPTKTWGAFKELGSGSGFNDDWSVTTNGRVVLGVTDALTKAPELTAFDLGSKKMTVLTDLNSQLRGLRLGAIESLTWETPFQKDAFGFLIKPVDYTPGKRYPLVVLLDDGTLGKEGEPFLFDAAWQMNGHAIQMLAGQGFMVLYPREPKLRDVIETPQEGIRMREHIEAAVAHLDKAGLIDAKQVGISGWSRAGYHTHYLLIHSSVDFAAATVNDGGGVEYTAGMRPFTDAELQKIRTPLLFEPHGLGSLVHASAMRDRLAAMGKPTEVLYFATASHSTTRPQHRMRSLSAHIDWWRFWLKGEEDSNPAKADQYIEWRKLQKLQHPELK